VTDIAPAQAQTEIGASGRSRLSIGEFFHILEVFDEDDNSMNDQMTVQ
jgi:hypothetical protein